MAAHMAEEFLQTPEAIGANLINTFRHWRDHDSQSSLDEASAPETTLHLGISQHNGVYLHENIQYIWNAYVFSPIWTHLHKTKVIIGGYMLKRFAFKLEHNSNTQSYSSNTQASAVYPCLQEKNCSLEVLEANKQKKRIFLTKKMSSQYKRPWRFN